MKAARGDRMSLRAANVNYCFSQKRLGFGSEFQFSPIWGGGDIRIVPAGATLRVPLTASAVCCYHAPDSLCDGDSSPSVARLCDAEPSDDAVGLMGI